jgi:hypothetical protein
MIYSPHPFIVMVIKWRIIRWGGGRRVETLRERDYWRDPGVDRRIILRRIFRKWYVGVWTGLSSG